MLAKSHASTIPSHICGVAVSTYANGSTPLSSDFRRAASAPTLFPAQKLSTIAGHEQRERVRQRAEDQRRDRRSGKSMMLRPRSPWKSAAQKLRYCFQSGTSNPNAFV